MIEYLVYAFVQASLMTILYGRTAIKWQWCKPKEFFVVMFVFAPLASVFLVFSLLTKIKEKDE